MPPLELTWKSKGNSVPIMVQHRFFGNISNTLFDVLVKTRCHLIVTNKYIDNTLKRFHWETTKPLGKSLEPLTPRLTGEACLQYHTWRRAHTTSSLATPLQAHHLGTLRKGVHASVQNTAHHVRVRE